MLWIFAVLSNSAAIKPIRGIREIGETGALLPGLPGAQTGALPQFFIFHSDGSSFSR
jgi:hypothetical protein